MAVLCLVAMASAQSSDLSTDRRAPPPRDVNQLTDAELRRIAQTMTAATRVRARRILSEYVTPARCQRLCGNPDCGRLCNRCIRPDRSDEHVHHFCKSASLVTGQAGKSGF